MALLDFSKAFDRAWREGLLHVVSAKGLPIPFSAHPEHLDKSRWQMPITRLPQLEGVGVEKRPSDEN